MKKQKIIEGNKLIGQFMGWHIDVHVPENYPNQEWHTSKKTGSKVWDCSKCVNLDSKNIEQERDEVDSSLWDSLLSPIYGRAGRYHLLWDHLMPVVEKIESFKKFTVAIDSDPKYGTWVGIHNATESGMTNLVVPESISASKIKAVWNAVVLFIKWYNSQEINQ